MQNTSNTIRTLAIVASIAGVLAGGGRASGSPVQFGPNYYDFVQAVGISWADANAAASASVFLGVNGHLATITSAAENDFLANSVADFSAYNGVLALSWLGAQVDSSYIASWVVGPEAGQQFSSGSAGSVTPLNGMYVNWGPTEPNTGPSAMDMFVSSQFDWFGNVHGQWGDAHDGLSDTSSCNGGFGFCEPIVGYFVEYETPVPAALPLFATGLGGLGLLGWRRKRKAQAAT
jgi:hypothetical protein